jgi:hypothetical protein
MSGRFSTTVTKYLGETASRRKELLRTKVSQTLVHSHLASCFWTNSKSEHHGKRTWRRKDAGFTATRKQPEREGGRF